MLLGLYPPIAFGALHQRLYRDLHENALGACTDRARWSAPNAIGGNVLISSSMTSYASLGNQTANYTSSTTPPATPKPTLPASLGNQTANHTSSTTPPATTKPTSP
ncbi:hypothetical protein PV326_008632, partial [Microctonus aethiopoides]